MITEFPPPRASNAAPAQSLLRRLGLDRDLVVIGPARTTREEAVAVAALCRARGYLVCGTPILQTAGFSSAPHVDGCSRYVR